MVYATTLGGLLLVASCAACSVLAPASDYRNSFVTSTGAAVVAQLVNQTNLKIDIDGQPVIDDQLSMTRGDGRFRGQFKGLPVEASCTTAPATSRAGTSCSVSVGPDRQTLRLY